LVIEDRVKEILGLRRPVIKIGFLEKPPEGVARWTGGPVPAGCAFWDSAMEGKTFYTLPSDHYNCAVGCHTHRIQLPAERVSELDNTIGFMLENRYLDRSEVPGIPVLAGAPAVIAYGPVNDPAFQASAVLLAVTPAQTTLLYEAGLKAGVIQSSASMSAFSRPSCAVLPISADKGSMALSFGCRGNRTFTTVAEGEMYVSFPGAKWPEVAERLREVQRSNLTMGTLYQAQSAKLGNR
jgi:uncharacterized protein (DUF169 family)